MTFVIGEPKEQPQASWANEEVFSLWLSENTNLLIQAIGLDELCEVRREVKVAGGFKADIVAKICGRQDIVIIENLMHKSDHKHVGQLITYGRGFDANVLILVAPEIRYEHRKVFDAENTNNENREKFVLCFGVEFSGSPDDPKFNVVVRPNGSMRKFYTGESLYEKFWTQFNHYCQHVNRATFGRVEPKNEHFYNIPMHGARISLTIPKTKEVVGCKLFVKKDLYAFLQSDHDAIRTSFLKDGITAPEWKPHLQIDDDSDAGEACIFTTRISDVEDSESWVDTHVWMKKNVDAFHNAFDRKIQDFRNRQNQT
jgi:hypothetical protein